MRCSERMPNQNRYCSLTDEHDGVHRDEFGITWSAENAESVGFTREELTAAAARQAKVAPSKEEILAAMQAELDEDARSTYRALAAVEKLFADRGL